MKVRVLSIGFIASVILLAVSACVNSGDSDDAQILGEWKLVSIRSMFNNSPDIIGDEGKIDEDVFYSFRADSTYQMLCNDSDEQGVWNIADSTLTICADDTTSTIYKILRLDADTLSYEEVCESEFGTISEITTLVRIN